MLAVAFVAFSLFNYVGDPVNLMLGQDATPEQKKELRESLRLDQPDYVQFAVFVKNAVKGEFGLSLKQGRLVSTLIKERLPATLELALVAGGLALIGGLLMGLFTPRCDGIAGCRSFC